MFVIRWAADWPDLSLAFDEAAGGLFVIKRERSRFTVSRHSPIGFAEIETLGL